MVDERIGAAPITMDHPHAHVIIRGVDSDGREVRLARD